eukprot:g3381.t1
MEKAYADGAADAGPSPSSKKESIGDVTAPGVEVSSWRRIHAAANRAVDERFYQLGYWVATHPKLSLLLSLAFVVLCSIGFVNFKIVTDGSDYALLLLESAVEGGNVLTKNSVDTLWALNAKVLALETGSGNTYTDLCTTAADGVTCKQPLRGITRFWANDFATYENSVTTDADVLAAVNVPVFPDGQVVLPESVFGNSLTYDSSTGSVAGAQVFMQSYELQMTANDDAEFKEVREWEQLFHNLIEGVMAGDGEDDIVMIAFITVNLGKCGAGSVRRRSWLGLAGVMVILCAGVAAYGLNSGFSIPFTTLAQILPFILIGIGVDDMIVIVSAFDQTNPNLPVERRIALALKRCGLSITYTSMTNFFAFMLGSATSLPAVEYFCLYAGSAILFDFFLQVTAFVACLAMDANRQQAGRMDWLCCFRGDSRYKELEEEQARSWGGGGRAGSSPPDAGGQGNHGTDDGQGGGAQAVKLTAFGRFMKETYTPLILSREGKTLVLLGSLGILVAGVYGVTQATQGFDPIDLAPDDHHARHYTDMARTYELEIDTQYLPLSIYTLGVDYTDVSVQAQMQATDALMVEQRHVVGPVTSWLSSFVEWAANSTDLSTHMGASGGFPVYDDPDTFYTALSAFTQDGDNSRFESEIVYDTDGTIAISRTQMFLIDLTSTENGVRALKDSREVIAESSLAPSPLAFSQFFIFSEQFLVIYDELIVNYILALVAVAVLSVFVLGDFAITALVCFTVIIIDVELLGFVYHWGLDVNSLTVIELIMAVGLVVDYMVHVVHYFLHQDPNVPKDIRIADGLGEIGPSVVVGAATTFSGIMPMAFASNHVFRVFLKMFIIIIGFGHSPASDRHGPREGEREEERTGGKETYRGGEDYVGLRGKHLPARTTTAVSTAYGGYYRRSHQL